MAAFTIGDVDLPKDSQTALPGSISCATQKSGNSLPLDGFSERINRCFSALLTDSRHVVEVSNPGILTPTYRVLLAWRGVRHAYNHSLVLHIDVV